MTKNIFNIKMILVVLSLSTLQFSCAKKPSGIRTVTQTESRIMNPAVSNPSNNAASVQNISYKVTVVELPGEPVDGAVTVKSEIQTPNNKFIPISTTHQDGKDAFGIINDGDSKLEIKTRCIGEKCDKYVMLVTIAKNNQAIHQILVISYYEQNYFNVENLNKDVTIQFYKTLDEAIERNGERYK